MYLKEENPRIYLNIIKRDVISAPTDRPILIGREVKRMQSLIGIAEQAEVNSGGVLNASGLDTTSRGLLVKAQYSGDEMQDDGAYLNELQLTREQLVRDEVVTHVSVIVLEQIDADERIDSRRRQREHSAVPVRLAKARLACDEPVQFEQ